MRARKSDDAAVKPMPWQWSTSAANFSYISISHEQSKYSGLDAFAFGLCIQAQLPVNFVEQLHCILGVWVSPEQNFVNVLDQSMVRDRARCWMCDGRFLNLAFLKKNIARSFSLKHTAVPQSSHPLFKLQGFHVIVVAARKVFEFGFPQNEHCPFAI